MFDLWAVQLNYDQVNQINKTTSLRGSFYDRSNLTPIIV